MPLHLHLTVRFFDDRYHGSDWPPSPARLFQALVAGAMTGAPARKWNLAHKAALEWLAGLGPPEIHARPKSDGQRYRIFVPNNSGEGAVSSNTSKAIASRILADHSPGDPDIVYCWPKSGVDAATSYLPALDQVAARLRALGWGIDFAAATATLAENHADSPDLEHFTPGARDGLPLPTTTAGLLEHLVQCHNAFTNRISAKGVDPYTRPTRFGQTFYRRAGSSQPRRWIAFELRTPTGGPFATRWKQTQTVAAWLRHAAADALADEELRQSWIDSYVLGHTSPENLGRRMSFVPLPSVGHRNSDGSIRRVMIVEPPDTPRDDSEALDLLRIKLAGSILTDEDSRKPCAMLVPIEDCSKVLPFYTRVATVWETVTPVILHGHNAARGRISLLKTGRLLLQAFVAAGFPEPLIRDIAFQTAPYWSGCEAASAIRAPHQLAQWPRIHVRVEFSAPVQGPVFAGIGRHCGLGIFAACREG
jgi:CRISPR-associated protein Csb2